MHSGWFCYFPSKSRTGYANVEVYNDGEYLYVILVKALCWSACLFFSRKRKTSSFSWPGWTTSSNKATCRASRVAWHIECHFNKTLGRRCGVYSLSLVLYDSFCWGTGQTHLSSHDQSQWEIMGSSYHWADDRHTVCACIFLPTRRGSWYKQN